MPELPEVEVKRLYLERTSLNRTITRVSILDKRILESITPAALGRSLKGSRLLSANRRGKYLLAPTDKGYTLLMHFGMNGDLVITSRGESSPAWSRVEFYFEKGVCLHYTNMRLIGKIALYQTTVEGLIPDIAKLGGEPLDRSFTFRRFMEIVKGHNTTIHQLLMNQELIAGIGNIYSDEITFRAGILPYRRTGGLIDDEIRRIYDKIKWVLRRSIELDADLDDRPREFLSPNRTRGGSCPRSHGKLVKKTIGGRSSYFCPKCQN